MLGILIKKQLTEIFRSMFYDEKKNRMRSKWAVAGLILLIFILTVPVMGGLFTMMALSLCSPLASAGVGWLYFLIMIILAVVLGAIGSVLMTYSGLYMAKDNDLLLSLPIPVRTIMASRLINVYLMGTAYAALVMLPALIVYWAGVSASASVVFCGVMLLLIITLIVLMLSCLLGWAVARISLRLKHKSFAGVALSLGFLALYYTFYFRAGEMLSELTLNAAVYGERIKGSAYVLYLLGRIGEGDIVSLGAAAAATGVCAFILWRVMASSFISIATSTGAASNVRYVEKAVKQRSPFEALLAKELGRFASSSAYMLNCGLGIVLIPLAGIMMLIKGSEIFRVLDAVFASAPGVCPVAVCSVLCMLSSMNNMALPSVSLEGKSLWIPRSLPVAPRTVIMAKLVPQLLLTGIPMLFSSVCAAAALRCGFASGAVICAFGLSFTAFSALFGMFLGLKMPVLTWTSEIAPIKQNSAVLIAIFGTWIVSFVIVGGYLLGGSGMGAGLYILCWTVLFSVLSAVLLKWLDTRGSRIFSEL